jgi:hypothetical protein
MSAKAVRRTLMKLTPGNETLVNGDEGVKDDDVGGVLEHVVHQTNE